MFLIIHNPLSMNKKSKKTTHRMVRFFKRNKIPFMIRSTLKIDNLNDYLDKSPKITDILYLGGDGSINYLVNHVDVSNIKQNIYLAKSGSGNDFYRSLKRIKKGNISIAEIETNNGNYRFINSAGIGIDSLICHYVNNDEKKGKMSYFINFFRAIIKYKKQTFEVTVDGEKHEFKNTYFTTIQNGKYFGGGMKVAPEANIEKDEYEVCVAHNLNNLFIQMLFISIYSGLHKHFKKRVTFLRGKDIKVSVKESLYLETDGEVYENINNLHIREVAKREFIAFNKKEFRELAKKYHSN